LQKLQKKSRQKLKDLTITKGQVLKITIQDQGQKEKDQLLRNHHKENKLKPLITQRFFILLTFNNDIIDHTIFFSIVSTHPIVSISIHINSIIFLSRPF